MIPPVYDLAFASTAVKALLGTSPIRVFPFGINRQQPPPLPYAVWQTIGGGAGNYLGEVPDADSYTVQVDVYAEKADDTTVVAEALRDAFEPSAYIRRWGNTSRDAITGHYRYSFDVDFITVR